MERRSLDYWARHYTKGIEAGQDYSLPPAVICINILDFGYIPLEDFHTSFHIYEDRRKEYMLTDALELHFLDMVKFKKLSEKDIQHDPLHRWLVCFDKLSLINLIEEVLCMDPTIWKMQEKIEWIQGNPDLFRAYLRYEKAASQEGMQEGLQKGRREGKLETASNMKKWGLPVGQIAEDIGLSVEKIAKL
jgi:predicted transposase/invertase (TIGR01784 family)